jgi:digalactosyldiacylglycerol synthase
MGNQTSIQEESGDVGIETGKFESLSPEDISETFRDGSISSHSSTSSGLSTEEPAEVEELFNRPPLPVEPQDEGTGRMIRSSAISSECYRLPIFRRKSDPLTVLHAKDSESQDDNDTPSCFPSKSLSSSKPSLLSQTSAISFQSCKDGNTSGDGGENDAIAASTSSILGCVTTPLQLPKSASWSNLMGLEDTNEQYAYTDEERNMEDGDAPTMASNLQGQRDYWIVTTAALPWMTGTAVNPLLRAAYLSQRNRRLLAGDETDDKTGSSGNATNQKRSTVTLVLPWLEEAEDRLALYGPDWEVATPERQESYIRDWLVESAQLPVEANLESNGIHIQWYPARYHKSLSSIFAMGDLCELIPQDTTNMICILEEPEHVNCYRAPGRESWRDKFPHVIGIVHTNYKAYAQNHYSGLLTGPIVGALMGLMVRAYCDKVLKLSPVLQSYAPYKEVVSNVHGIRQEFFEVPQPLNSPKRIYFIGKLLWAKGLDKLMELEACYRKATGSYFGVDVYGSGPQEAEIQKSFLGQDFGFVKASSDEKKDDEGMDNVAQRYWRRFRQPIPARFLGREDHAQVGRSGQYQIFLNPSITEVLCTTTAEAVAMGFWVIVPKHASNEFFMTFGNCLQYSNRREFVEILRYCLKHDPPGWGSGDDRSTEERFGSLSWGAATARLIETAYLSKRDAKRSQRLQPRDRSIQEWHYALGRGTGGDVLRKVLGGGPVADQSQYTSNVSSGANSPNSMTGSRESSPGSESERATKMIQAMMEAIGNTVEDYDDDDSSSVLPPISLESAMCEN